MKNWIRNIAGSEPMKDTRILVSDGEFIAIARYTITETERIWFFEGVASFDALWWMPLEPLPPKITQIPLTTPEN